MRNWAIIFLVFSGTAAFSQFQVATLQFGENLPQATLLNPGIAPDHKIVIGLPGISSAFVEVTAPLSFNDLWKSDGNRFVLNENGIAENAGRIMRTGAVADVQLLVAGFKVSSGFMMVSIRNRFENKVFIPGEVARWAVFGPADPISSNTLLLDEIGAIGINYLEYGISYSQPVTANLRMGARLKYLSGVAGISGSQDGYVYVNSDSASINVSNLEYTIAGSSIFEGNAKASDIYASGNSGFGMDLGMVFKVNSDVTVSASVTDLGFINWKNDLKGYKSEDASYSFSGFELTDLFFGETEDMEAELDTLIDKLEPREVPGSSFRTGLNGKLNFSARYRLAEISEVGFTFNSAFDKGKIDPVVSLNHNLKLGRSFFLLTGLSYLNGKVNNISGGLIVKPGPIQFYFISDRVNSFFYPSRARSVNLRFGMNIVIGRPTIL